MGSIHITPVMLAGLYQSIGTVRYSEYAPLLDEACRRHHISDNTHRLRAFLAQIGHESGDLRHTEENLNYSAEALRRVFPKYFPDGATLRKYARQPEMIANRVYANRLGNGDEASGDGWRYRGRGLIQLTGKENYIKAGAGMAGLPAGVTPVGTPDIIAQPRWAAESAAWWWEAHGLNALADGLADKAREHKTFREITRRINGGYNGLTERMAIYLTAKEVVR